MTHDEYLIKKNEITIKYEQERDENWCLINQHKAQIADLKRTIDLRNESIRDLISKNSALHTQFKKALNELNAQRCKDAQDEPDYAARHARRDGFKLQRKLQAKMKELLGDLGDQLNVDELKVEWQYDEEEDAYTFDVIIPKTTNDD